jgi:hypothetical protein
MARLALAIGGAVAGAFIPGLSVAMGFAIGSTVGNLLFPASAPDVRNEGPHLTDTRVSVSLAGVGLALGFATDRYNGNMIWCGKREDGTRGIIEVRHEETIEGGKGVPDVTNITYSGRLKAAYAFAEGPASQIIRVWADSKCVYDSTGTETEVLNLPIKWYLGTATQLPDPTMEADEGAGNVPAYRGTVFCVIDWDLTPFNNHPPSLTAEIAFDADAAHPFSQTPVAGAPGPLIKDPLRPYAYSINGGTLYRYNTSTKEVEFEQSITLDGGPIWTANPGLDADGNLYIAYSSSGGTDKLAKIDGITGQVLATTGAYGPAAIDLGYLALDSFATLNHPIVGILIAGNSAIGSDTGGVTIFQSAPFGVLTSDPSPYPGASYSHTNMTADNASYRFWCADSSNDGSTALLRRYKVIVEVQVDPLTGTATPVPSIELDTFDISAYLSSGGFNRIIAYPTDNSLILGSDDNSDIIKVDIEKLEAGVDPVVTTLSGYTVLTLAEALRNIQADGVFLATGSAGTVSKIRASDLSIISTYTLSSFSTAPNTISVAIAVYDPASNSIITRYSGLTTNNFFVRLYLDRYAGNGVGLDTVVEALSNRVGLATPRIDVTELEPFVDDFGVEQNIVHGYSIRKPSQANACIRHLMPPYFFYGVEEDFKIKFRLLGGDSVVTITEDDLGAELGEQKSEKPQPLLSEPRTQDKELPRTLTFECIDPDRNYDQNAFPAKREAAIVASQNDETISVPVVFPAGKAKNIAIRMLYQKWIERYGLSGTVMPKLRYLSPGDPVTILYHGVTLRVRFLGITDDMVARFTAVSDRPVVFDNPNYDADGGTGFNPGGVNNSSTASELFILDIPLLLDSHQTPGNGSGLYIAVGAFGSTSSTSSSPSTGGSTVTASEGQPVVGTSTTLSVETAHNTSAYSDYNESSATAEVQGNFTGNYVADGATIAKNDSVYDDSLNAATPGNVSKINIKTLLYSGATTRVGFHFMPWFKNPLSGSGHINVGYNSNDQTQVDAQIADMKSRGGDWTVVDWYGQGGMAWSTGTATHHNQVTAKVKTGCESTSGMDFCICVDVGAIPAATTDKQGALISELNYIAATYYGSSKYLRWGGRPVVHFFGLEAYDSDINWDAVRTFVNGNPLFIFRNSVGIRASYADGQSNGGFAWPATSVDSGSDLAGTRYLDDFYKVAKANPLQLVFGCGWGGFNGTLTASAAWSLNKHIAQQNGLTLLQTVAKVNSYYNTSNQLPFLMFVWNDIEEGNALEFGIENGASVTASMSTDTLNWSVSGGSGTQTVNHFTVLYGTDGSNFTVLNNFATSTLSLDLATALSSAPSGTYKLRVKAYGKPSIRNKMSNEVTWVKP